jgi:hypothetical protein
MLIRVLCRYYTGIDRPGGVPGEVVGVPMWGAADLPTHVDIHDYVFMCVRIMRIRHEADGGGGQPFDMDWESNGAFRLPGEEDSLLTARAFLPVIGVNGFL